MSKPKNINETLDAREKTYGDFDLQAMISQDLKQIMRATPQWPESPDIEKEALDMIVHKMARILNGGVRDSDNWHDIAGYATLVEREMVKSDD